MSITIIIGAHGKLSEQLLKTTEMILGKQDNVAWVEFMPGENVETLIKKYNTYLASIDEIKGILFLVDTWGGSPFNAANRIVINKENMEIVTGINIPMLIEIFMARDDKISLQELTNIAINTGRLGIKSFKNQESTQNINDIKSSTLTLKQKLTKTNKNNHMSISLTRIDDRLIHGQVATRWTKETCITLIIVVNDEVDNDPVRKALLTQVAPPGVTAHVVNIEKAVRVYNNPKYEKDRVMLLLTNPKDVLRLVEKGVKITSVNIGGMAFQEGKKQINNAISVNEEDILAFKKLNEYGIELEIRKVPSDKPLKIMDLIKNFKN